MDPSSPDFIDAPKQFASETASRWREAELNKAKGYIPVSGLMDAMEVARLLGQPLLLTGEPGTGKTEFSFYLSLALGLSSPLVFETKSTSTARDLFYTYDTLGRFQDAQIREDKRSIDQLDYITYNALGIAILRSNTREAVEKWLPKNFEHASSQQSVVLIDEIDKAPRDFPNDILNEIENMYFKIPELRDLETHEIPKIEVARENRPILIITSNSEKHLPDAFLRRCIYYNIPFPQGENLVNIIFSRLGYLKRDAAWFADALSFFSKLREPNNGLDKRPATAELLGWLKVLHDKQKNAGKPFHDMRKDVIELSLSALLKSATDQKTGKAVLEKWLREERARLR